MWFRYMPELRKDGEVVHDSPLVIGDRSNDPKDGRPSLVEPLAHRVQNREHTLQLLLPDVWMHDGRELL